MRRTLALAAGLLVPVVTMSSNAHAQLKWAWRPTAVRRPRGSTYPPFQQVPGSAGRGGLGDQRRCRRGPVDPRWRDVDHHRHDAKRQELPDRSRPRLGIRRACRDGSEDLAPFPPHRYQLPQNPARCPTPGVLRRPAVAAGWISFGSAARSPLGTKRTSRASRATAHPTARGRQPQCRGAALFRR